MTKRRNHYKFTKRKKSVRGIMALFLAVMAAAAFVGTVLLSFRLQGNGSVYLGSVGVLSVILSVTSFILAVLAVKEEETYKAIPYAALVSGSIMSVIWIAVYVVGFLI